MTFAEDSFSKCWARILSEFKTLIPVQVSGIYKPTHLLHSWKLRGSRN